MSLRETQKLFSDALKSSSWQENRHPAEDIISDKGNLSVRQRLEIYRNTGLTARISALEQIYPVCRMIIGERPFANLAGAYAMKTMPDSPDLNLYGHSFIQFMSEVQRQAEFKDYSYLQDLCELEWLWHGVYYREEDKAFNFSKFAEYSKQADKVFLTVNHALEIMCSDYPVHRIWQANREKQKSNRVSGLAETEYLCIYRDGFTAKVEVIDAPLFNLLNICRRSDVSLQGLALDNAVLPALSRLPDLIARGWISGFLVK